MNFRYLLHKILFFFLLLSLVIPVWAQAPDGYYDSADGKKDAELKTALFHIIKSHTQLDYYTSSTYFLTTDWHPGTTQFPGGYIWDMYSNFQHTTWSGMNREHSLPKSWWSAAPETTVAYSDLHNLYPSDATANTAKLNYGLGEVTGTPDFSNGVVKVGTNGFPGFTGTVFEPADEYKGDFARDYMYVVTCYEDYANNWRSLGTSSMLLGGTYPVFRAWAVNLLLKWHRQDPVSSKETNRNNAVYSFQHNRNPFIDHPELAEFIWGKYMGSPWSLDGTLPEEDIPLTVQPNPVSSILTAKVNKPSESTYYILNLSGIVMKTGKFASDGTLSVDELQNDMYILMVYSETSRKVTKFIVHH
jgi:endonuclease I